MEGKIRVSAVILTLDEVVNIGRCVEALRRFDEVVVVDSFSKDGTLDILKERYPEVRVFSNRFEDFGQQRNWALEHTDLQNDWVLFIDADEFMEEELAEEVGVLVAAPGETAGAFIAGRNYFMGRWLRYSTFFPSYQLRLLKRGAVRYRREGHGQREVTEGQCVYLKNTWRHEGFSKGVVQWVARHNRYSTQEVPLILKLRAEEIPWKDVFAGDAQKKRRGLKILAARLPFRALWQFIYALVIKGGFRDGRAGLYYALLQFTHYVIIGVKVKEEELRS